MAYTVIDRRLNGKGKSASNRQKFVKRVKKQVKDAVKKVIRDGKIGDIVSDKGKKINIPVKDLNEPQFHHGKGGSSDRVFPGNKDFTQGDRINRPPEGGGGGGGKEGSPDGEGEDDFEFHLTQDEFLEIFFEDLELPDLLKKDLATVEEWAYKRSGFSTDGTPSRLNVLRSMKQAKGRRFALRAPKKRKLKKLQEEEARLKEIIADANSNGQDCSIEKDKLKKLQHDIEVLKKKIRAIPFIDDMDIRYNRWDKVAIPTTQAVMFCVMDVSASMGQWEKEMAKRFFMLLYLFLNRSYERVDLVFIRHHTIAKEVDEDEFFYGRESGGTVVSPALEMMNEIIKERYPLDQWNIYGCQASDGDNWPSDNIAATDTLKNSILPLAQYFAYVEIDQYSRNVGDSDLWPHYDQVRSSHDNMDMAVITDATDIYPVFRGLFESREQKA